MPELSDLEVAAGHCEVAAQELERAASLFGNVKFLGRVRICSRRRVSPRRKRWSMNGQPFTPQSPIPEARGALNVWFCRSMLGDDRRCC